MLEWSEAVLVETSFLQKSRKRARPTEARESGVEKV
jgi:hypothetical protein